MVDMGGITMDVGIGLPRHQGPELTPKLCFVFWNCGYETGNYQSGQSEYQTLLNTVVN